MATSHRPRRRYPQTIGGVVYLLVLAACVTGLVLVVTLSWRTGLIVVSAALAGAAAARVVIPDSSTGMLKVRARWIDVLSYGGLAALLLLTVMSVAAR